MGLLQDISNLFKSEKRQAPSKPVFTMPVRGIGGVIPPEMVSNTRTGQAQVPYNYYQRYKQTPISLDSRIAQIGQLQQITPRQIQQQSEYNNLQGYENPGYIPLQSGGSYINRVQPQQYKRMIQGF